MGTLMPNHRVRRLLVGAGVTLTMLSYAGVGSASAGTAGDELLVGRSGGLRLAVRRAGERRPGTPKRVPMDMRAIHATSAESYAVNQGRGARIGDIDTGIDLTNSDIMPNVDVAASACSWMPICRLPTRPSRSPRVTARKGSATGPRRSRHPHRGHDRRADQRRRACQASLHKRRSSCSRPGPNRATSSPSRWWTRGAMPVTSTLTRQHEVLRRSVAVQLPQ